jgi:hypothetical protein
VDSTEYFAANALGVETRIDFGELVTYNKHGVVELGDGQAVHTTPETIVKRIDAILLELQELRRAILVQSQPRNANLAEQLYGALGQGSWNEYDSDFDRASTVRRYAL